MHHIAILSHDEREIFRLLDALGQQLQASAHTHSVWIIDDNSQPDHFDRIRKHSLGPAVIKRSLELNFAAQRNFLHSLIPLNEWILWLDADEMPGTDDFLERLQREMTGSREAIALCRRNTIDAQGVTIRSSDEVHVRAVRNVPQVFWINRLHEVLFGYDAAPTVSGTFVLHAKTDERCAVQDAFYRAHFGNMPTPINEASSIEGWMSDLELEWLASHAATRQLIVEVGAWKGRSTMAMAANCHGRVISVDHFHGSNGEKDAHEEARLAGDLVACNFYRNLFSMMAGGKLIHLRLESTNAARVLIQLNIKADMVFIDGCHISTELGKDIRAWQPVLAEGGLLCGHDSNWPSVQEALRDCNVRYSVAERTTIWTAAG